MAVKKRKWKAMRRLDAPRHKKAQSKSFLRLIAPSVLSIFLCSVCLVGLTWAWFSASDACEVGAIQTSQFTVSVKVSDTAGNAVNEGNLDGSYTLRSGSQ